MRRHTNLKEIIVKNYGFDTRFIKNVKVHNRNNINYITFQVNNIKYCGWTAHDEAFPQLKVLGYTHKFYDHNNAPITKKYYDNNIKNKFVTIVKYSSSSKETYCLIPGKWEVEHAKDTINAIYKSYSRYECYFEDEDF